MNASRLIPPVFLALLLVVPLVQWRADAVANRSSLTRRLLREKTTAASLKAIEEDLKDRSITIAALRPVSQWAQFLLLKEAGSKVLLGEDGWMFYRPSVEAAVLRGASLDPLDAIIDFRDSLAMRGIELIVVPAPNKESVYPERLTGTDERTHHWNETDALFAGLQAAGIAFVDLREAFAARRASDGVAAPPLYLKQDTHWSPTGLEIAAQTIADAVREKLPPVDHVGFSTRSVLVTRHGDLLKMLDTSRLLNDVKPESMETIQVLDENGDPLASNPTSDVLLMGDSFLRIFERDEPGSAGLSAHLALALGRPVTSLIADGGASTLVRQELYRHPELLRGKRLVIWEFVERDLRLGTEGWQRTPLPPL